MSAKVEIISALEKGPGSFIANYDKPYVFALEELIDGGPDYSKHLLVVHCSPESLITRFYKSKAMRDFPPPVPMMALTMVTSEDILAEITPDQPFSSEFYDDKVYGPTSFTIQHHKDHYHTSLAAWQKIPMHIIEPDTPRLDNMTLENGQQFVVVRGVEPKIDG